MTRDRKLSLDDGFTWMRLPASGFNDVGGRAIA